MSCLAFGIDDDTDEVDDVFVAKYIVISSLVNATLNNYYK